MRVLSTDWVPRLENEGALEIVEEEAQPFGASTREIAQAISDTIAVRSVTETMVEVLLSDAINAGKLTGIEVDGTLPGPTTRYSAPSGMGSGTSTVWFTTPNTGTEIVRWYVDGVLKVRRSQDLSTNRGATYAELGAVVGDNVQVCIEAGGVVGWWAETTLA